MIFSDNTDVAVKKAAELADPDHCTIHLLHVTPRPPSAYLSLRFIGTEHFGKAARQAGMQQKLLQCKTSPEEAGLNLHLQTHLVHSEHIQNTIIRKAKELAADLVVIGKKSRIRGSRFSTRFLPTAFPSTRAAPCGWLNKVIIKLLGALLHRLRLKRGKGKKNRRY